MDKLLEKIPHRAPALLIDRVIELGELRVRCAAVREAPAYTADGRLPAAVGLEMIAQAAAVWVCQNEEGNGGGMLVQASELCLDVDTLELEGGLEVEVLHLPPSSGTGLRRFRGAISDSDGRVLVSGDFMLMIKGS